jgi:arabinogalactan endo-1,4-beta-galactosidase
VKRRSLSLLLCLLAAGAGARELAASPPRKDAAVPPIRGVTVGPIESTLQPGRGYGSARFDETLETVRALGGNWISLTVFGRVWDTDSAGVTLDFERPFEDTREAVRRSVAAAHARGLRVLLVPHLWVESGKWRAELDPGTDARWAAWAKSYERFAVAWARVAEESDVDLLAAGVELRSWVTSARAPSFLRVLAAVRREYSGLVTYAANWDDVDDTVVLGALDVIGINAFYPLHFENGASRAQLADGGRRVAEKIDALSARYERPVIFTEFGYTTRENTAIEPWLWPEQLGRVPVSQGAQAEAYAALLGALLDVPGFGGVFVWRMYADPADMSQEEEWGFSPRGKLSEGVLEDAYKRSFWGDGPPELRWSRR